MLIIKREWLETANYRRSAQAIPHMKTIAILILEDLRSGK
jgi:hypothetical protein